MQRAPSSRSFLSRRWDTTAHSPAPRPEFRPDFGNVLLVEQLRRAREHHLLFEADVLRVEAPQMLRAGGEVVLILESKRAFADPPVIQNFDVGVQLGSVVVVALKSVDFVQFTQSIWGTHCAQAREQ